jgi:flagellar motor switch protein FliN/FliY
MSQDQPTPEDALADAAAQVNDMVDQVRSAAKTHAQKDDSVVQMPVFDTTAVAKQARTIDLLSDVNLNVKIELGRTRLLVEDVLKLAAGAIVELDKLAGDPVDVYVNDRHVARGEVLVLNDNFCVRINEILAPSADGSVAA